MVCLLSRKMLSNNPENRIWSHWYIWIYWGTRWPKPDDWKWNQSRNGSTYIYCFLIWRLNAWIFHHYNQNAFLYIHNGNVLLLVNLHNVTSILWLSISYNLTYWFIFSSSLFLVGYKSYQSNWIAYPSNQWFAWQKHPKIVQRSLRFPQSRKGYCRVDVQ